MQKIRAQYENEQGAKKTKNSEAKPAPAKEKPIGPNEKPIDEADTVFMKK